MPPLRLFKTKIRRKSNAVRKWLNHKPRILSDPHCTYSRHHICTYRCARYLNELISYVKIAEPTALNWQSSTDRHSAPVFLTFGRISALTHINSNIVAFSNIRTWQCALYLRTFLLIPIQSIRPIPIATSHSSGALLSPRPPPVLQPNYTAAHLQGHRQSPSDALRSYLFRSYYYYSLVPSAASASA